MIRPPAAELRRWSIPSHLKTAFALTFDFGAIFLTVLVAERVGGLLAYFLAIPLIGARQHALYAVAHEAVHSGLAKSRKVNDLIGEVIGWMFLLDFQTYRRSHLGHHKYLNTMDDPDWARYNAPESPLAREYKFPTSRRRLAFLLLGDLLGLRAYQLFAVVRRYNGGPQVVNHSRTLKILRLAFYGALVAFMCLGGWKLCLLYWIVPIFTWAKMNLRLRLIAEHYAVFGQDGSRSVTTNWLERYFLWPHNTSYHAHHHAYPGVRFFKLPALAHLLGDPWYQEAGVAKTMGLPGLFRELTARP